MIVQPSPLGSLRAKAPLPPDDSQSASTWPPNGVSQDRTGTSELLCRLLNQPLAAPEAFLEITREEILGTARKRMPLLKTLGIFAHQFISEAILLLQGIRVRLRCNKEAVKAYLRLTPEQLERVNLRQAWANWRVIPMALSKKVPDRPLSALDLCCGVGQSTEVLAHYLPLGSSILGIDVNSQFIERAGRKHYSNRLGHEIRVQFTTGSVLEAFNNEHGHLIGNSIDLVLCAGALGQHFDYADRARIAAEIWRVLRRNGLAIVDARGKKGRSKTLKIFSRAGFVHIHSATSCVLDRTSLEVFAKV